MSRARSTYPRLARFVPTSLVASAALALAACDRAPATATRMPKSSSESAASAHTSAAPSGQHDATAASGSAVTRGTAATTASSAASSSASSAKVPVGPTSPPLPAGLTGTIVFSANFSDPPADDTSSLYALSLGAAGGAVPRRITADHPHQTDGVFSLSGDAERVLFVRFQNDPAAADLMTTYLHEIALDGTGDRAIGVCGHAENAFCVLARYAADGRVYYAENDVASTTHLQSFPLKGAKVETAPLLWKGTDGSCDIGGFSIARDGKSMAVALLGADSGGAPSSSCRKDLAGVHVVRIGATSAGKALALAGVGNVQALDFNAAGDRLYLVDTTHTLYSARSDGSDVRKLRTLPAAVEFHNTELVIANDAFVLTLRYEGRAASIVAYPIAGSGDDAVPVFGPGHLGTPQWLP